MPRLKDYDDVDVDELEEAEYNEGGSYSDYDGEEPPRGTILSGYVKKLWLSETRNQDPMLIALFEAAGNEGDEEQYNGWATWEYLALIATAKFRWAPFFDVTGIALRDLIGKNSKLFVEEEDDQFGAPIEKIGKWEPGEGNEDAWVRIVTKVETKGDYKGRAKIDKWLHWEDAEAAEEPDDEPDDESEETPEQEAPKPRGRAARGASSRSGAATSTVRTSRTATAEAKPAAPASRTRSRASAAKPATAATAPASRGRGRGRSGGSTEEPPF